MKIKRFDLKVGQPFPGEIHFRVIVDEEKGYNFKRAALVVVVAITAATVITAVSYAKATGDYAPLRALAEYGKDALGMMITAAMRTL